MHNLLIRPMARRSPTCTRTEPTIKSTRSTIMEEYPSKLPTTVRITSILPGEVSVAAPLPISGLVEERAEAGKLRPFLLAPIHPSAWKGASRKFEYRILHTRGPLEPHD